MNCLNPASASGWFQKMSDTSEYTYWLEWNGGSMFEQSGPGKDYSKTIEVMLYT